MSYDIIIVVILWPGTNKRTTGSVAAVKYHHDVSQFVASSSAAMFVVTTAAKPQDSDQLTFEILSNDKAKEHQIKLLEMDVPCLGSFFFFISSYMLLLSGARCFFSGFL